MNDQFEEKYGCTKESIIAYLEETSEIIKKLLPGHIHLHDLELVADILRQEWDVEV